MTLFELLMEKSKKGERNMEINSKALEMRNDFLKGKSLTTNEQTTSFILDQFVVDNKGVFARWCCRMGVEDGEKYVEHIMEIVNEVYEVQSNRADLIKQILKALE